MVAFHLAGDPKMFPQQLVDGVGPWSPERQVAVVPRNNSGARVTQVVIDPSRKYAALACHRSQAYSVERMLRALASRDPMACEESLCLVQSRDTDAMASGLGIVGIWN